MHIVLTFDDAMVGPAAACLTSVAMNRGETSVTAHILHDGVASHRLRELVNHCTKIGLAAIPYSIDAGDLVPLHAGLARQPLPVSTLYRCLLARYIPAEIEQVLYLDCDTIALGSIAALDTMELRGAIAAVGLNPHSALRHLGIGDDEYFNSGVMAINMALWRSENIEGRLLGALDRHSDDLMFMDQCALNIALRGRVIFFEPQYNYIYDVKQRRSDFRTPVIIHYAGGTKPWKQPYSHPWSGAYIEFAGMTPWPVSAQRLREWNVPPLRAYRRRLLKAVGLRRG